MAQTKVTSNERQMLSEFKGALDQWSVALEAHSLAPPDQNFSARLAGFAVAAREQARACRDADAAGFDWPPHRAAHSDPPYELRPGTGRRGPEDLWRRFDAAVAKLSAVATGKDIVTVAEGFDELAAAASDLADAVGREDRAGTRRTRAPRTRRPPSR
jgi:hypothetical protein